MNNDGLIELAVDEANENLKNNFKTGGPFGAVIVKNGEIIARAHNTVLESNDPTAHAEVNAIRLASKKLQTHDLKDCIIYASSEPCPMCLSSIIWSNIKVCYYANTKEDSARIGFRDDMIYDFIKGKNVDVLEINHIENDRAKELYNNFENNESKIMY